MNYAVALIVVVVVALVGLDATKFGKGLKQENADLMKRVDALQKQVDSCKSCCCVKGRP